MVIGSMGNIYTNLYQGNGLQPLEYMVNSNLAIIYLFVLISSVALTIYRLFQSKDTPLLISLPTSDSSLFTAKLYDSFSDTLRTMILPFPVCIAFVMVISRFISPLSGMLFLLCCLCIAIQIGGLSVIFALLLGRYILQNRIGNLTKIIAGLISLGFLVILMFYIQRADSESGNMVNQLPFLRFYSAFIIFPSSWMIKISLNSFPQMFISLLYGVGFLAFTLACPLIAFEVFKTQFYKTWEMNIVINSRMKKKAKAYEFSANAIGRTRSLILKDLKITFRDPHILLGLFLPLFLFPIYFFIRSDQVETQSLYIIVVALLSTVSYTISCFGREGRIFPLLRSLPINVSILLRAKLILSFFINLSATLIFVLAVYIFQKLSENQLWYNIVIAFITSIYFSIFGVSLAAIFPKFDFVTPMRAVTMPGILLLYIITALFSASVMGIKYINWYFIPMIFIPWAIIGLLLMKIGMKRLEKFNL